MPWESPRGRRHADVKLQCLSVVQHLSGGSNRTKCCTVSELLLTATALQFVQALHTLGTSGSDSSRLVLKRQCWHCRDPLLLCKQSTHLQCRSLSRGPACRQKCGVARKCRHTHQHPARIRLIGSQALLCRNRRHRAPCQPPRCLHTKNHTFC